MGFPGRRRHTITTQADARTKTEPSRDAATEFIVAPNWLSFQLSSQYTQTLYILTPRPTPVSGGVHRIASLFMAAILPHPF